MTRFDLFHCLETSESTISWYQEHGLILFDPPCVHCGQTMTLYLEECLYKCKKYACRTKKSILFGSIFENSKINLDILIFLFYEWCVKTPMQCAAYK